MVKPLKAIKHGSDLNFHFKTIAWTVNHTVQRDLNEDSFIGRKEWKKHQERGGKNKEKKERERQKKEKFR